MPAVEAQVRTVWTLVDRASRPAQRMIEQFQRVETVTARLHRFFGTLAGQMLAMAGIGAGVTGVGMLVRDFIRLNTEMEETTFGMGGLLWQLQALSKVQPFRSLEDAVRYGRKVFLEFEEYAKNAAGSAQNYIDTWKAVLTPLATAGASLEQVEHITKMLVPQALALGYSSESAAMSIMQMAMGMARAQNTFVMTLLKMGGYTVRTWNELARRDPKKAIQELIRILDLGKDAAAAYGNTMASQLSTVEDNIMQLKRAIGHELWEAVKKVVIKFNDFMAQKDKVEAFARRISEKLVAAFRALWKVLSYLYEHMDGIVSLTKRYIGFWVGKQVMSIVASILKIAESWKVVRDAAIAAAVAENAASKGKFLRWLLPLGLGAAALGAVYGTYKGIKGAEDIEKIGERLQYYRWRMEYEQYARAYQAGYKAVRERNLPVTSVEAQRLILDYVRRAYEAQRKRPEVKAVAEIKKTPELKIPPAVGEALKKLSKHGIRVHIQVEKDRDYPDRIAVQVFDALGRLASHPTGAPGYVVYER